MGLGQVNVSASTVSRITAFGKARLFPEKRMRCDRRCYRGIGFDREFAASYARDVQICRQIRWLGWMLAFLCLGTSVRANEGFEDVAWAFFDRHCLECHDDLTAEGGLDLGALDGAMATADAVDRWTSIFDRVESGEMPPAKKDRPEAGEVDGLLKWIDPHLTAADRARREVVQRRLNREEYQNTVNDLLAIDVDVVDLLPEDQWAGGFDNNGAALSLSAELMVRYLEAARKVIDAAIVLEPKPETVTFTVDSLEEVQRYIDSKLYGYVDGRVISYLTSRESYSKISTRKQRTVVRGRYRFNFSAVAHQSDKPLVFSVVASDFAPVTAKFHNLGYFEATPEPKEFVIEALLDEKSAIQFFPLGLPVWIKDPASGEHPGIGFSEVEVTGPLIDEWPPKSHRLLFGDANLEVGTREATREILARFAARAFRRPLEEGEIERYLALVDDGIDSRGEYIESLKVALTAVLCSPNFLYLCELENDESRKISKDELATRLAYFLTSSMPDFELRQLVAAGDIERAVERCLEGESGETFVRRFVSQWLHLHEIEATTPDSKLYPEFDERLQVSMVAEAEAFFRHILENDLPLRNFIDSDFAMLNNRLAELYEIEGVDGWDLRPVILPEDSVRGGVLTQAGLLKVTANGTNTSPVVRGVWVLENILGKPTPPPPPNVGGIEPDIRGATTIREQLDLHRDAESCAVCHRQIDPPGFALESFDPVGAYRVNYKRFVVSNAEKGWGSVQPGAVVDASGVTAHGQDFSGIREFKLSLLQREDDFTRCLTEKLLTYGLGRELGYSDRTAIDEIVSKVKADGGGLRTLIHSIVAHEIFKTH